MTNNRAFKDKTLLLEAGNYYQLKITGIIDIPGCEAWFIGKDDNGLRHLIPVSFYAGYGIKPESSIECRLDKINCQGRFFFEPRHPFYSEGRSYSFDLIEIERCTISGEKFTARVKDMLGKELVTQCFSADEPLSGNLERIKCRVERIKKATPFLKVTDNRLLDPTAG